MAYCNRFWAKGSERTSAFISKADNDEKAESKWACSNMEFHKKSKLRIDEAKEADSTPRASFEEVGNIPRTQNRKEKTHDNKSELKTKTNRRNEVSKTQNFA